MSFTLGKSVKPVNVFMEHKSNVTGRWDPFYFRPELVALEKRIRSVTPYRLRDFVESMAGGATPSTTEAATHYTDSNDGVPFIRVQNLSTTGRLNLEDCKRITRSTHEGLLARSGLTGGELLVKITGVGRMAVASVVPEGFEGNINQHIVAIRTKDIKISETLAAYLNLDVAERLASRRSTGGTRPALDYPSLRSIPVVVDERIPALMRAAVERHQKQINEATALLAKIDDVLFDELGILRKPELPNTIESRTFRRSLADVTGMRLDPMANQEKRQRYEEAIHVSRYRVAPLRKLVGTSKVIVDEVEAGQRYVGLENVDSATGELVARAEKESVSTAIRFQSGQILFPKLRPYLNKTHIATFDGICSTEFHVFTPQGANGDYLTAFLRSRAIVGITSLLMTGNTLPRLQLNDIEHLPVPVPPPEVQRRLAGTISSLRAQSRTLREKARAELEQAKRNIEALVLGKGTAE